MERNPLLLDNVYEPSNCLPSSFASTDSNHNGRGYQNGSYSKSGLRRQSSLNTFDTNKKSFDLSSTFERSQVVLGWEDINVFVHKPTGLFERCLKRGRGNIEFVVKQILNGGTQCFG